MLFRRLLVLPIPAGNLVWIHPKTPLQARGECPGIVQPAIVGLRPIALSNPNGVDGVRKAFDALSNRELKMDKSLIINQKFLRFGTGKDGIPPAEGNA
jgi:hypothetical protein